MGAGLVDRLQVTIFPVISGRTGTSPILGGAGDLDLELLEARTLDGHTQALVYRPTPRYPSAGTATDLRLRVQVDAVPAGRASATSTVPPRPRRRLSDQR